MHFDLGVNLAFWLTIISTLICVAHGALNWNKGANETGSKTVEHWAQEEDKIDEDL